LLGDGHFGHLKFKIFLFFDFDGHLVDRHERLIGRELLAHGIRRCQTFLSTWKMMVLSVLLDELGES
jgi:hypothetical protein